MTTFSKNSKLTDQNRILLAAASLLLVVPVAQGQEDAQEIEEVIVVGTFRESLAASVDLKRNATGFRDSIVAEDIGKFPDLNLAEALQRIPGVAISRDNGEGQQATVRGLGPEFTRVQLNSMSISSSAIGGTDQGSRGRHFDFDIFPSELFTRIDIEKSARSSLEEGGIAGSMNLRTAKPFDYDGFIASVSGQAGYSGLPDDTTPRLHALVSNRTDSWGWTLQGAYSERAVRVDGSSSVDWTTPANSTLDISFPDGSTVDSVMQQQLEDTLFARLPRTEFQQTTRERTGVAGALQFRPSDQSEFSFDIVYAELARTTFRSNLDAVFRSQRDIEVLSATVADGAIATGTFRNVERRSESRHIIDTTDVLQVALSGVQDVSDNFSVSGLLGIADSKYDSPETTTWLFQVVDSEVNLDFTRNPRLPSISTAVDLTDPASYTTAALRIRPETIQDASRTARLDLDWGDDEANLKFGVLLTGYEKDRFRRSNDRAVVAPLVSEYSMRLPVTDFASSIGNSGQFPSNYLVADPAVANTIGFTDRSGATVMASTLSSTAPTRQNDTWKILESTYGGYIESNVATTLAGRPLTINAGTRIVKTSQTSDGFSNGEAVSIDNSYDDVLPSGNVKLEVSENALLRASFAQTITRPSLDALRPNTSVRIGNTGTGGNPTLQPFRSSQLDLGWEWYFADDGLVSVAAFYKNISGFIVSQAEEVTLRSLGIPLDSLDPQGFEGVTLDTFFTISRPVNSSDPAELVGFEITYQQGLDHVIEGLGVLANYTNVDSEVEALSGAVTVTTTLPGLSPHSFNVTAYYETDRFSGRLSYNWRDNFVESTFIRDRTGLLRSREAAGFLDLSASYNLNEKIALTVEGINLLDTEEYTFTGFEHLFNRFIHTGSQWFLGVRATL